MHSLWKVLFYCSMTVPQCKKPIKTWLDEFGVVELDCSLELNPIEHLWDETERRLQARLFHPTSMPDLANALLELGKTSHRTTQKSCGKPCQKIKAVIAEYRVPTVFKIQCHYKSLLV